MYINIHVHTCNVPGQLLHHTESKREFHNSLQSVSAVDNQSCDSSYNHVNSHTFIREPLCTRKSRVAVVFFGRLNKYSVLIFVAVIHVHAAAVQQDCEPPNNKPVK